MLSQQLSRIHQSSRRQVHAPCSSVGACPVAVRQPVNQNLSSRQLCPAPHVPLRHQLTVANASRRGRPPASDEEPTPEIIDDDIFTNDDQFDLEEGDEGEFEAQLDPLSRRFMGKDPEDDDEEHEFDEDENLEDESVLDEAAEADRDGAAADNVGEPSTSYPEPPSRIFRAADLFGEAALFEEALWLAANFPDVCITGVQSNPDLVVPGDLFVPHPWVGVGVGEQYDELEAYRTALANGAVVLLGPSLEQPADAELDPVDPVRDADLLPDHVPLLRTEDHVGVGSRLATAFYGAPSREMVTVGVLGVLGKTTTAWLIRGILEELGQTVGLVSSIEHAIAEDRLDEEGHLWEAQEEDPSAERESSVPFKVIPYAGKYVQRYGHRLPGLNAQKLLAGMYDRGAGVAVMEIGGENLMLGTYDLVDLNVAVVTGLSLPATHQHSEHVVRCWEGTVELALATLELKLRDPDTQALVLNLDDPAAQQVLQRLKGAVPVVTYGIASSEATVWAESIKSNIWETEVIIRTPSGRLQVITNLLGRHNVCNLLAAVATGVALKAPLTSIVAGIEAVEIPGRSEVIDEGQEFSVVVDAARNPDTLGAMLDALRAGGARQIFTVFGCSGNEDPSVRPKLGAVAHAKSDYVILTNDSPRLEDPAKIVGDIVAGFPDDMINRYSAYAYFPFQDQGRTPLWFEPFLQKAQRDNKRYIMEDRYSAIRAAIGTAGPEDVVLLAGKGHGDWVEHMAEDGGILRGWLDDRVEARNALSKLKYLQAIPDLNRDTLPWGSKIETLVESVKADPSHLSRPGTLEIGGD